MKRKLLAAVPILAALLLQISPSLGADGTLLAIKRALPAATKYTPITAWEKKVPSDKPLNTVQNVYNVFDGTSQIGVAVSTEANGYGGPIYQMVVLDMDGTVRKAVVTKHQETLSYVTALTNGSFLKQFEGITLLDKMSLLVRQSPSKRGEIQAMTGATMSSKPITIGVYEARKAFSYAYPKA